MNRGHVSYVSVYSNEIASRPSSVRISLVRDYHIFLMNVITYIIISVRFLYLAGRYNIDVLYILSKHTNKQYLEVLIVFSIYAKPTTVSGNNFSLTDHLIISVLYVSIICNAFNYSQCIVFGCLHFRDQFENYFYVFMFTSLCYTYTKKIQGENQINL